MIPLPSEHAPTRTWVAYRTLDYASNGDLQRLAASRLRSSPSDAAYQRLAAASSTGSKDELLATMAAIAGGALSKREAAQEVLVELATQVVEGRIMPYEAARAVWWELCLDVPELREDVSELIGLASEWEDDVSHRAEYEEEILRWFRTVANAQSS